MKRFFDYFVSRESHLLLALWLFVIVTFASVITAEYVLYDETIDILGSDMIKAPLSFASFKAIFSTFTSNQFTPLSVLSFWLEYNIFGFNSSVSHLVSLLLHLACVTIVFWLLKAMTQRPLFSWVVAAVWALHPMQVETVAWVLERRNLLYGFFYFASMHSYVNYQNSRSRKSLALATVCLVLAGLSKALAFILPLSWLMLDWLKGRKFSKELFYEKIPALCFSTGLFSILFLAAKAEIINSEQAINNYLVASYGMSLYIAKTFLPFNMSAVCEINTSTVGMLSSGPVYFLMVLIPAIWIGLKNRLCAFGVLFYFLHILPLSGLIRVGYQLYAGYHFMFLPLFGVLLALAGFIDMHLRKPQTGLLAFYLSLVGILVLAGISFNHSFVWQNSETLFKDCLQNDLENRFARNQLAVHYEINKRYDEAIAEFSEVIRQYPTFYGGYHGLGRINMALGKPVEAGKNLDLAVKYNVGRSDILNDRGYLRLFLKQYRGAEEDFSESLGYYENAEIRHLRSETRRRQGDYSGAANDMQAVISEQPANFSARASLVETLVEGGRYLAAVEPLLIIFSEVNANPQNLDQYKTLLFTPSFRQTVIRMLPLRNFFYYRLGWYPW